MTPGLNSVIRMTTATPKTTPPTPQKLPWPLALKLLGVGVIGFVLYTQFLGSFLGSLSIQNRISKGDRLLVPSAAQSPARTDRKAGAEAMASGSFSAVGAGGEIRFLSTGDRSSKSILVQIKAKDSTYEFVPIPTASPSVVSNP